MNPYIYLGAVPALIVLYFILVRVGTWAYFKSKLDYLRSVKEIEKKGE